MTSQPDEARAAQAVVQAAIERARARRQRGDKAVNPAKRRAIFERLRSLNPQPKTELEYATPYQLLVAVVLSAQATDTSVNKATRELFEVADTPQGMVALGEERLAEYIKTIGLFRTKAKNVIALSRHAAGASTAARCRATARRWRRCPASAARPRTWC